MKSHRILALLAACCALPLASLKAERSPDCTCDASCGADGKPCCCAKDSCDDPAAPADTKTYMLKGVVKKVLTDDKALLVKHDAIPDFMPAMTMAFNVEPAVLTQVKEGATITAKLVQHDKEWWLSDVKVVPADQASAPAKSDKAGK